MASFEEGLAGSLAKGQEQRQQGMLEMAMLSKRIEMESQARQAEMKQAHGYNMVTGPQATSVLSTLGVSPDKLGTLADAFPEGLPSNILSSTESALGMQARTNAMLNKPQ